MKISQISIFLENRNGRLNEVCGILGDNNINIRALNIAETPEFGVLRLVVNKPQEAVDALKKSGFVANITDIVAVEVEDRPGGLAKLLLILDDSGINVEYMYGFIEKLSDNALMVFRFDDNDKAIGILKKNNIKIIGREGINSL